MKHLQIQAASVTGSALTLLLNMGRCLIRVLTLLQTREAMM
jgi:hypothetical protein